ncbi:MAG TPA: NAD(P)-binding domain-containing protein, partial [Acidimicrobiales bacterium]|nr:NAD(P)-binding domain-containing protein [Acidimicrobiales bacterium]
MRSTEALVIGAGQAGLAMSRSLSDEGIDHVVIERGRLAERWRSERWDSVRLLSPNWATRLPGAEYRGDDPQGFMTAAELVHFFEDYASAFDAPVHEGTTVESVTRTDSGFDVLTSDGSWRARSVVIATGWNDQPRVPSAAADLPRSILQLTPSSYRNPDQVAEGGVLVVGASSSGAQIADELARAGRDVTLAVGRHARLPRRYRGFDIWWWLDQSGRLAVTIDEVSEPRKARNEGSLQLVGSPVPRNIDMTTLAGRGVRLTGRFRGFDGATALFASDLGHSTSRADAQMQSVLSGIDEFILRSGLQSEVLTPDPPPPVGKVEEVTHLSLSSDGIKTIVWATGFTRSYPWLHVPGVVEQGEIVQRRGVTGMPGLYVLGQRFQHRRDSNFIDGVRH